MHGLMREGRREPALYSTLQTVAGVGQIEGAGPFAGHSNRFQGLTQIRGIQGNNFTEREEGFVSPIGDSGVPPDLAPYERIEVVKGPSSVLYGRVSAGGFVNRVRKKPLPEFHAELAPAVGSFDFYRVEGDVTGPLFDSDAARGRLVLAYEDAGAFVDGVDSETKVLAPSLDFDVTDSTRLLLLGSYQRNEFRPNPGIPTVRDGDTFRPPDIRRSLFVGVPNEDEAYNQALSGIAQLEQDLGDRWLATLRFNRIDLRRRGEFDSYGQAFGGIMPGDGDIRLYSTTPGIIFDSDVWSGELRLNGEIELLGRPANLTFGLDHTSFEDDFRNVYFDLLNSDDPTDRPNIYEENFADFTARDDTPYIFDESRVQEDTGVYGQIQFRPFERLSVLLGGRYDRADTLTNRRSTDVFTNEKQDDAWTGRAGLVFDVSQPISVYGLFAQSFDPVSAAGADGQILEPETGEIFEAGIKTEWLDGRLGVNAALFRLDRQDIPVGVDPDGPGGMPGFSISAGLQRTEGIELEINGEPLPGWNLSFGGSLSDFEFKDGPFVGSTPAGAADWQLGAYTGYEVQTGALKGLGLGVGLYAIDVRGASYFLPGVTVDGYERVDLSLFYNGLKDTKIVLQVRNVFDETYIESFDGFGSGHFGAPTAVLLTVRMDLEGLGK